MWILPVQVSQGLLRVASGRIIAIIVEHSGKIRPNPLKALAACPTHSAWVSTFGDVANYNSTESLTRQYQLNTSIFPLKTITCSHNQ